MNKIITMKKQIILNTTYIILFSLMLLSCTNNEVTDPVQSEIINLSDNWKMQPIENLEGINDAKISQNDYETKDWYKAIVPGTVLGSLATTGVIEDPYFGINMQKVGNKIYVEPNLETYKQTYFSSFQRN